MSQVNEPARSVASRQRNFAPSSSSSITPSGQGFIFEGLNHTSYRVEYTANADCMSHHTFERVIPLSVRSRELLLSDLWQRAIRDLATLDVTIEFSRDVIHKLSCAACGSEDEKFVPVGSLSFEDGRCAKDGQMRTVQTVHSFTGSESYGRRSLDHLGLPLFDVFTARTGDREIAYLIAGDQDEALGASPAGHS